MKRRLSRTVMLLAGSLAVAGCADVEGPQMGEGAGTVLGAIGGSLLGDEIGAGTGNILAVSAGALIGAVGAERAALAYGSLLGVLAVLATLSPALRAEPA